MENVEKINLIDLEIADYNPRRISDRNLEKLRDSIHSFGFVDPIIINLKNNRIIGGHQRYRVLMEDYDNNKELNLYRLGDVGWAFPDTDISISSEEQEKALNIILNQNNLMGEWDNEKLKGIFKDLNNVDFDLELTGFEDFEIELFLDDDYETFNYQHLLDDEEEPEETTVAEEPEKNTTVSEEDTWDETAEHDDEDYGYDILSSLEQKGDPIVAEPSDEVQSKIEKLQKQQANTTNDNDDNKETTEEEIVDYADVVPDDYVDVKGDNANKSYVLSIGFDTHEIANQFLEYIGYHRRMNRDTLQFMFTELDWDMEQLLQKKYDEQLSIEEQELLNNEEKGHVWEYH